MVARILIAEDHVDSLELMRYLLSAHGYAVVTAADGEAALAVSAQTLPDLIICDLQMPKLNGFEVVRRLKLDDRLQHIPVIAVTAFSMLGDRENVLAAGFNGYFSKPIEPERFVSELEQHLPPPMRARPRSAGHTGA